MQTIGERIKSVRKANTLTQLAFSEILRISRPHVSRIESDKDKASGPVLLLISILFNVSEKWLESGLEN